MKTLVAVPIIYESDIIGSLYVSEREDARPFTPEDQATLERFAAHAAIAVVNSRLYQQLSRLSALEERQRIAMDLHDGVLQSFFGVSLALQNGIARCETDVEAAKAEMHQCLDHLAGIEKDIRSYVQDLRRSEQGRQGLEEMLEQLLESVASDSDVKTQLIVRGGVFDVPQQAQWALWHVIHEAASNAIRHGHARSIDVHLVREAGQLRGVVQDDGQGFDTAAAVDDTHNGLANMRRRIEGLGGRWTVLSAVGHGTTVIAEIPMVN